MKRIIIILTLITAAVFWSCSEDKPSGRSIYPDVDDTNLSYFDKWLDSIYTVPYNIDFRYRYVDMESDLNYELIPARLKESQQIAALIRLLWIEPYRVVLDDPSTENVNEGDTFIRTYGQKVISLVGSAAYNNNQTMVLGQAEGGLKVTLYVVNWLDRYLYPIDEASIVRLNEFYFKTMHHEFAHILHQTIDYPTDFNLISTSDYSPSAWQSRSDYLANRLGFVSAYGSSQNQEDFVETFAVYITSSDEEWEAILTEAATGSLTDPVETGRERILRKLEIVKQYMRESWGFEVDELRDALRAQYDLLLTGALDVEYPLTWF